MTTNDDDDDDAVIDDVYRNVVSEHESRTRLVASLHKLTPVGAPGRILQTAVLILVCVFRLALAWRKYAARWAESICIASVCVCVWKWPKG